MEKIVNIQNVLLIFIPFSCALCFVRAFVYLELGIQLCVGRSVWLFALFHSCFSPPFFHSICPTATAQHFFPSRDLPQISDFDYIFSPKLLRISSLHIFFHSLSQLFFVDGCLMAFFSLFFCILFRPHSNDDTYRNFRSVPLKSQLNTYTEKGKIPVLDFLSTALESVEYERALTRGLVSVAHRFRFSFQFLFRCYQSLNKFQLTATCIYIRVGQFVGSEKDQPRLWQI